MTSYNTPSQCLSCAHWTVSQEKCEPFPDGIPKSIWLNRVDHRQPYPGDGGIRWESNGFPHPDAPSR